MTTAAGQMNKFLFLALFLLAMASRTVASSDLSLGSEKTWKFPLDDNGAIMITATRSPMTWTPVIISMAFEGKRNITLHEEVNWLWYVVEQLSEMGVSTASIQGFQFLGFPEPDVQMAVARAALDSPRWQRAAKHGGVEIRVPLRDLLNSAGIYDALNVLFATQHRVVFVTNAVEISVKKLKDTNIVLDRVKGNRDLLVPVGASLELGVAAPEERQSGGSR